LFFFREDTFAQVSCDGKEARKRVRIMEQAYVGTLDPKPNRLPCIHIRFLAASTPTTSGLSSKSSAAYWSKKNIISNRKQTNLISDVDGKGCLEICETSHISDRSTDHVYLWRSTSPLNSPSVSPKWSRTEHSYWLTRDIELYTRSDPIRSENRIKAKKWLKRKGNPTDTAI